MKKAGFYALLFLFFVREGVEPLPYTITPTPTESVGTTIGRLQRDRIHLT